MDVPRIIHPHPDHLLTPLFGEPLPPITTQEFLYNRLREIGLDPRAS